MKMKTAREKLEKHSGVSFSEFGGALIKHDEDKFFVELDFQYDCVKVHKQGPFTYAMSVPPEEVGFIVLFIEGGIKTMSKRIKSTKDNEFHRGYSEGFKDGTETY